MIPDYHMHTHLCKHASGTMEEYVQQALKAGCQEIAFTDHIPLPQNFDLAHRMRQSELDGYFMEIERLRWAYPKLKILCGIEADFYDGFELYLEQFLSNYDFDLVIMSVHFIKKWPEGNWAFSYHFPDKTLTDIYAEYLDAVLRGIRTGLFDIVGHLDLVKSPEQSLLENNRDQLNAVIDEVKKQNMAIEINTSGLRKDIEQTYPDLSFLPLIARADVPITLGSDAHKPEQVALKFSEITKTLSAFENLKFARYRSRSKQIYHLNEDEV